MHNISSCSLCEKSINHRSSTKSNLCQSISHLKCNDLNYVDGLYLKNSNISWYCRAFCADIFPFTNAKYYKLYHFINNTGNKYCETDKKGNMSCVKTLEKLKQSLQ